MLQTFDERNRNLLVNVNGVLSAPDEARISPFDSVVQGGDAVWEGLRLYDGCIFRLTEHLARLRASAQALAFTDIPTDEDIIAELRRTLEANAMTDGVHVRLTLTRGVKITSGMDPRLNTSGPTLIIVPEFKPPVYDTGGLSLITAGIRRIPPDCLDQKIHSCNLLNSILAKIQANAAGADDALMLDYNGCVAETNATHLFFVIDGELQTSDTGSCPEGITRSTVLSLCREHGIAARVADITLASVFKASEVFCTGTMGELAPVTTIDGRTIGDGEPGPLTRRLGGLYQALTRTEGERVVGEPAAG